MSMIGLELKDRIIGFLNAYDVPYEDVSLTEADSDKVKWVLIAGTKNKVVFQNMKNVPDRVTIETTIALAEQHQKITREWDRPKFNDTLMKLSSELLIFDIGHRLNIANNSLLGISISDFAHGENITIDWVAHVMRRCLDIKQHILNELNIFLGMETQIQQERSSDNPLSS